MAKKTFIIGDVHGMAKELEQLLYMLAPAPQGHDTIVFAGDLLDKGPDSAGAVAICRKLRQTGYDVVLVKGNHEEKHARFRAAYAKAGDKVKMKGIEEMKAITADFSPEDIEFLESAVMFHRLPEHNALVVHAGFLPTMGTLPTDGEIAAMSKGERSKLARILRVRHVTGKTKAKVTVEFSFDFEPGTESAAMSTEIHEGGWSDFTEIRRQVRPKGSFISLGQETDGDPFWAEVYGVGGDKPRFGHVYFGHNPFIGSEPARFPHATGLDTGCVFGGSLTAAVLEAGQEPSFLSVPASRKYATSLWEE